jgi:hypothetical protein
MAQEAPEVNIQKITVAGQTIQVWKLTYLNPDCSSMGSATVRVLKQPDNGKLEIADAKDFTNYPAENIRHKCNDRPTDAVVVRYKANAGFAGLDDTQLEYISPIGTGGKINVKISVK